MLPHGLPEAADRALHQSRIGAHFHLLRLRSELEANTDRRSFVDIQRDTLLQVRLKTFRLNFYLVVTDREFDEDIRSLMICNREPGQAGFDLSGGNGSGLNDRAARITHRSANAPCDLLCASIQSRKETDQEQR